MKKFFALLPVMGLLFISCEEDDVTTETTTPEPEPVNYTSGSADFSTYVAVGNSLTAGFSDGALFRMGQEASMPNMLATQFSLAGGGEFSIPFMNDDLGGMTLAGNPIASNRLILSFASLSPDDPKSRPSPVPVSGQGTTEITNTLPGPFNNMGVPGAKSFHLLAEGYGNPQGVALGLANPYFARFASEPNATILGDAAAQQPTFFSLWIGNNDVLSYVAAGGDGQNQLGNLDPSTYGSNDITDPRVLGSVLQGILGTMTANGAKGVIANIPDVTTIPYLTTVPHNPVPLDEATAALLNGAYAQYNGGLAQLQQAGLISAEELAQRTISFAAGEGNAVVILDENLTDLTSFNPALVNMRQATEEDLVVLPASSFIGSLADPNNPTSINGVAIPLADKWVLTPEEQEEANTAMMAFNDVIKTIAEQFDIAFVDANALLTTLRTTGITLKDGSKVTADFGTGGGFSLDGVHPSPRGYAILANEFIRVINEKYGSNLPAVNPLDYTGLYIN
ncbi:MULTISPECIES: SGNH/GDSL hydrolase family protein [Flavobacteriaceae]|uniref:SGNH/GDSL hydrolase family protein n=1 Tax=Flavobacteriaceae TaxID=49546 RepID=UPI0010ADF908|nr:MULTISPECIES: SGNH/GDSL hydrolase family protein [Flavobacteriaceae]NJB36173.1 G-D-S-L family lipolytic protein [Croceivirga sp. JEA036]TKD66689.1 G-D-S-L family lipolytic protein [Flavobacterium sp. ASW18X]